MSERTVGRPPGYKPEFCQIVVDCGAVGMGKAEIAAKLGVVRQTVDNWSQKYPPFLDALQHARELSLAWWNTQGREGIYDNKFNSNLYSLQVRNRFPQDWQDRKEIGVSPEGAFLDRLMSDEPEVIDVNPTLPDHGGETIDVPTSEDLGLDDML